MTAPTPYAVFRTGHDTGALCPCGAPMASDGQGVPWCIRGRQCPAIEAPPLPPQCPHGLDWRLDCTDCQEDTDEAERRAEDAVWRAGVG